MRALFINSGMPSSVRTLRVSIFSVLTILAGSAELYAQVASEAPEGPIPPAVGIRDDHGLVTARAVRIARPIEFDGRLDDEVYQATQAIEGFLQQEPKEGAAASERTETWIFFDDRNIYVSARCWD